MKDKEFIFFLKGTVKNTEIMIKGNGEEIAKAFAILIAKDENFEELITAALGFGLDIRKDVVLMEKINDDMHIDIDRSKKRTKN